MRLLMIAALFATACASGPSLDRAIIVHNAVRSVVVSADDALAPVYKAGAAAADEQFPDDDVAYRKAMEPLDAALSALEAAKQLEQGLHLSISQWQAGVDDGRMTKETAACGAEALRRLGDKAVAIGGQIGPWLYSAVFALSTQLDLLADGGRCTVRR